jgi:hypothetical protein
MASKEAHQKSRKERRQQQHQEEADSNTRQAGVDLPTEDWVGKGKRTPLPPEAPQINRKVSFYWSQAIGMPLILLLPLLGLFRVFDSHTQEVVARDSQAELVARYPDRLRDQINEPMTISLTNLSGSESAFRISLERRFFEQMEDVRFEPQPDKSDSENYIFEIDSLPAGESEVITVDFRSSDSGLYRSTVSASSSDGTVVSVPVQTLVFP